MYTLQKNIWDYGIVTEKTTVILKLTDVVTSRYNKRYLEKIQKYLERPISLQKLADIEFINNHHWKYHEKEKILVAYEGSEFYSDQRLWIDAQYLKFDEELTKRPCIDCGKKTTRHGCYATNTADYNLDWRCHKCWKLNMEKNLLEWYENNW